jgi:nitrite reductase/ring-hydroxylating ferredoxin subunit
MLHKVASINEISTGSMKQVSVNGQPILVANIDGEFFAIADTCTHEHCSLSTGLLDGNVVYCPCHGGQFDVTTGSVVASPPEIPEPSYKVSLQGTDIYIEVA